MDASLLMAVVILLQFAYIVHLERQTFAERKDLYDRIMGVYVPHVTQTAAPKGKSPIHKSVDPDFDQRLKEDGLYK